MAAKLGLGSVIAVVFAAACRPAGPVDTTRRRKPDADPPTMQTGTVDFGPIFRQRLVSLSVYTQPKDRRLMDRVLVGPNVVFESSRSSLADPPTVGPEGATPPAPDMQNALGSPIDIHLSSLLMTYLSVHGSVILAPVVTRRWSWEWWCTPAWCPRTTWVERLVLMYQKPPISSQAPGVRPAPDQVTTPDQLPSVALAVRQLGIASREIEVVAVSPDDGATISYRPRRSASDDSRCPTTTLKVPVITFQAEIVSLRDGRILARIDEQRTPRISIPLHETIELNSFEPVHKTAHTRFRAGRPSGGKYRYVSRWKARDVSCEHAMEAYDRLLPAALDDLAGRLDETVLEVLETSLGKLY